MSLETTLARTEAGARELDWTLHKRHCPRCAHRARIREWSWLCPDGMKIRSAHMTAQARLAAERKADKAPVPGQATLF